MVSILLVILLSIHYINTAVQSLWCLSFILNGYTSHFQSPYHVEDYKYFPAVISDSHWIYRFNGSIYASADYTKQSLVALPSWNILNSKETHTPFTHLLYIHSHLIHIDSLLIQQEHTCQFNLNPNWARNTLNKHSACTYSFSELLHNLQRHKFVYFIAY